MSTVCRIKFIDRDSGVFFPGELVRCNVHLTITKPKILQEIRTLITGTTKVRWISGSSNSGNTYTNELVHFASKSILEKHTDETTFELSIGNHSYDFEAQLPDELPSSYQGEFGETHYEVKVTLAREWRFDNEFVQPFTVVFPIDLNQNIAFKRPTCETNEKKSHINCCAREPRGIRIRVETPISGYVPGQSIPVSLEVSNSSMLDCDVITVILHRHTQFVASSPRENTKYTRSELVNTELPGVQSSSNESFSTTLLVPPTPPSSPQVFDVIKIWYTISVEAFMGYWHRNLKMFVPMTIGTIPLTEIPENDNEETFSNELNSPLLRYMSSFEETQPEENLFVDEDRGFFMKYEPFTPKYPTFSQRRSSRY